MDNRKDYYRTLGVHHKADESQISSAFYVLVQRYHPDVCRDESISDRHIREINEAYEVLSDAAKRREYDRTYPSTVPIQVNTSEPGREPARSPKSRSCRERDIEAKLPMTPEEARHGGSCEVTVTLSKSCPACHDASTTAGQSCLECGGTRRIKIRRVICVPIPAGTSDGDVIRLAGHGRGIGLSDRLGDLILTVRVLPCW